MTKAKSTSWGKVADWYDEHLRDDDTYQSQVILPNLLRMIDSKKGESILDLGCGQGFFAREIAKTGAKVMGVDISSELIEKAKQFEDENIEYIVSDAQEMRELGGKSYDKLVAVLSIQNIKDLNAVVGEISRLLKKGGKGYIVLNHPVIRLLRDSSWGYDQEKNIQYRRLDSYMSEKENEIDMTPGSDVRKKLTVSFHRPLQMYFKAFAKYGLLVGRLEEWISHKRSQKGPRQKAEDISRKEFPMFMCLEVIKN